MMTELVVLTDVERRLASIKTLPEAKKLRDEAEAFRHYARISKQGLSAQNNCGRLRYLAERRGGELLVKLPRAHGPGRGKKNDVAQESFAKALEAAGISNHDAQRWQALARLPLARLEALFRDATREGEEITRALIRTSMRAWMAEQGPARPRRTPPTRAEKQEERNWRTPPVLKLVGDEQPEPAAEETTGDLWLRVASGIDDLRAALRNLKERRADVGTMLEHVEALEVEKGRLLALADSGHEEEQPVDDDLDGLPVYESVFDNPDVRARSRDAQISAE